MSAKSSLLLVILLALFFDYVTPNSVAPIQPLQSILLRGAEAKAAEEAHSRTPGGKSSVAADWREVVVGKGVRPPVFWCGPNYQVVWGGAEKGIRLADVKTGQVRRLTNYSKDLGPSCSVDGRYVFFETISPLGVSVMHVIDTKTNRNSVLFEQDGSIPTIYRPLSPCMNAIVGPKKGSSRYKLPDGATVDILPVFEKADDGLPKYFFMGWAADCKHALLFDFVTEEVSMAEVAASRLLPVNLGPLRGKTHTFSKDGRDLYFLASASKGKGALTGLDLYRKDLTKFEGSPELILEGVDSYDLALNGDLVFAYESLTKKGLYILRQKDKSTIRLTNHFDISPQFSHGDKAIVFIRKLKALTEQMSLKHEKAAVVMAVIQAS